MINRLYFGRLEMLQGRSAAVTPPRQKVGNATPPKHQASKIVRGPFGDRSAFSDRSNSVQCS